MKAYFSALDVPASSLPSLQDTHQTFSMAKKPKKIAPVHAGQTVSETLQVILRTNFEQLEEWEDAARSWEDIEGVHQTRVAFRRMRSALSIFRSAISRPVAKPWSDEMRDLANRLGRARDMDVFIDEALGGINGRLPLAGGDRLEHIARAFREHAYEDVRAMLDGEQYALFKRRYRDWVGVRAWEKAELKPKQRKRLAEENVLFARKLLDGQERRVLEAGTNVDKFAAEEMHRLRIECKKLRYAAEFFSPLFAGMEGFIGHMKGLQDLLGVMHDVSLLRDLLGEMLADVTDQEVLRYAGGLVGWRTHEYLQLLDGFDALWEEFVEAKHPWWRKHGS